MTIATINPTTGKTIRTFEALSGAQVGEHLDRAATAYRTHGKTTFADRAQRMQKAATILDTERRELGRLMTLEMGKPIGAAIAEAEKCATACRYYAENAERLLANQPVRMDDGKSWVAFQPCRSDDHAMEFPVLAGLPVRGTGTHGWKYRTSQARVERPAVRIGNRGRVPSCWI